MTFTDAIRSGFEHYTKFDGRASRAEYWWWFLFVVLVSLAANIIDYKVIAPLVGLALLLPDLSMSIRRLHDVDRSGWWILLSFIPIIGWIVLLVWYLQSGNPSENQYGPPPVTGAPAADAA